MTRRRYTFDADVDNDEWAERVDADRDYYPTPAELADDPTWPAPKVVRADTPLLAALQAGAERGIR